MSEEDIVNEEQEDNSGDGFADAFSAVALVLLAACFCIYFISQQ